MYFIRHFCFRVDVRVVELRVAPSTRVTILTGCDLNYFGIEKLRNEPNGFAVTMMHGRIAVVLVISDKFYYTFEKSLIELEPSIILKTTLFTGQQICSIGVHGDDCLFQQSSNLLTKYRLDRDGVRRFLKMDMMASIV